VGIIRFQQLTLSDKAVFDKYLHLRRYDSAHFNFTNLFMWRKPYNIEWAEEDGVLFVRAVWEEEHFALPPFCAPEADWKGTLDKLIGHFAAEGWPLVIMGAETAVTELLTAAKPDFFTVESDRDNFDYVYLAEDLIALKGRKYHGKKNHINSFKREYPDYEYHPLTKDLAEDCIQMAIEWCEKKNCDDDGTLKCERDAIVEALRNMDKLDFVGGVILLNGKVQAFSFGEQINEDTAVIHVEKGDPDIRGLYPIINQEFCLNAWHNMTYINREEDMGIEGLRKAKESYHPVKMIEKYTLRVRRQ
jgi:hypothetical protein